MKNKRLLAAIAAMAMALTAGAQSLSYIQADDEWDTGARLSAQLDYKLIPKKLHLIWEEEGRLRGNFTDPHKLYSTLGAEYRIAPWLKSGIFYSNIISKASAGGMKMRHRGAVQFTGSLNAGQWRFSLREKFQATYKAYDINASQEPRTDLSLKSRLKVAYDFPRSKWRPYAAVELRNTLNAANPDGFVYGTYSYVSSKGETKERVCWGNQNPKYNDIYIDRLRFQLGTEFRFRRNQTLDLFVVMDCNYDLDIDFNSIGIQKTDNLSGELVPPLTLANRYFVGIGVAYSFEL